MHGSNFCFSADPTKHFAIGPEINLFQLTYRQTKKLEMAKNVQKNKVATIRRRVGYVSWEKAHGWV